MPFPRILLDGVFFQLGNTGIARLWRSLLHEWSKTDFARHLVLLDRDDTAPRIDGIRFRPAPRYDYRHTGRDARLLQEICDRENADLFVSSYYTTPLTTPSAFVAYDLIPEALGCDLSDAQWREKHLAIAHASAFLAISEHTARDLMRFFPHDSRDLIAVCPVGVSDVFSPADPEEIERFRRRHAIDRPYFLTVGSRVGLDGYKNARLFFQAFARLPDRERFAIVCAGGAAELEKEFLPLAGDRPVHVLRLSDAELRAAYSGAVALVYPSKYEGFGLPVLEAMACGCPVVTCRNSALPEVAGDAAVYVNESNYVEMINALQRVRRPEVRQTLRGRGLDRARLFSWPGCAAKFARSLEAIAAVVPRRASRSWAAYRRMQEKCQQVQAALAVMGRFRRWTPRGVYLRGKLRLLDRQTPKFFTTKHTKNTKESGREAGGEAVPRSAFLSFFLSCFSCVSWFLFGRSRSRCGPPHPPRSTRNLGRRAIAGGWRGS